MEAGRLAEALRIDAAHFGLGGAVSRLLPILTDRVRSTINDTT